MGTPQSVTLEEKWQNAMHTLPMSQKVAKYTKSKRLITFALLSFAARYASLSLIIDPEIAEAVIAEKVIAR